MCYLFHAYQEQGFCVCQNQDNMAALDLADHVCLQIVVGTLMNLCDNPNQVSIGNTWRENDTIRRIPIIVTGQPRRSSQLGIQTAAPPFLTYQLESIYYTRCPLHISTAEPFARCSLYCFASSCLP